MRRRWGLIVTALCLSGTAAALKDELAMFKSARVPLLTMGAAAAPAMLPVAPAQAAVGPYARLCEAGKSAVLARVTGFKVRRGTVSVKLYASDDRFLDKGAYLRKVEVPVTGSGPVDVCVPVPSGGRYAIAVRHEVGAQKSRADGGGFSGNPKLSLLDVVMKRKPNINTVSFHVNGSTRVVPVVLNYLQGTSVGPVA
jgi:uncharacterized protein (DUF2141 family)